MDGAGFGPLAAGLRVPGLVQAHWWVKHHPEHPGGRARSCVFGGGGGALRVLMQLACWWVGLWSCSPICFVCFFQVLMPANCLVGLKCLAIRKQEGGFQSGTCHHPCPLVERAPSSGCHRYLCPRVSSIYLLSLQELSEMSRWVSHRLFQITESTQGLGVGEIFCMSLKHGGSSC